MRTRSKILLAALTAALVLGAAIGSASARRIETSEQKFLVRWAPLVFNGAFNINISCPVTLDGSFHSKTLSKVSGQLVGYVTEVSVGPPASCNGGSATILGPLPWHIRYDRFEGTLPAITGIRVQLVGAAFLVATSVGSCLYRSNASKPAFGIVRVGAGGAVSGLQADSSASIEEPAAENEFLCPPSGRFEQTGSVTVPNSTTRITVKLVQ